MLKSSASGSVSLGLYRFTIESNLNEQAGLKSVDRNLFDGCRSIF